MIGISNEAVTILEWSADGTSVHVEVYVDKETHNLVMAGQDLGKAPLQFWGDDEYEYFLSVDAADKDRLLLQLMLQVFGGDRTPRTTIAAWLDQRGIGYGLHSC